jgi:predicted PurR-regulated permease PerM
MDKDYFNKIVTTIILGVLIVLSFFLLKPILLSIIVGIILAFIFNPVYNWIFKITKLQNLSAGLICVLLILLIFLPLWFFTPIFIEQSFEVYLASQQMDFVTPLKNIFPSLFASEEFSAEIGSVLYSFVTKMTNSLVNLLSQLILNFPTIFLQLIVTFFTFFFVLRDKDIIVSYLQSILPFSKDIEKKLFESSKGITSSVIYGQVIIGMIQGLIVGLGLFIFNIPNALFLTLLASLAGIFPIIGTTIVWLPIVIYLFIKGSTFSAIGITMFGITSNVIDNVIRPAFVSKKTRMHPLLVLIGMIGGLFLFGILGFIIGPLIIAYVLIILEIYRLKKTSGIFTVLHE